MDVDAVLSHFTNNATLAVQTDHVTFAGTDEIRRMFADFFAASKRSVHEIRNIVVGRPAQRRRPSRGTSASCRMAG